MTPVYMESGVVYKVEASLWNTSYVIASGHSLRVAVTSSNYPRFSVNYNNGVLLSDPNPGEMITAHNTLYHSSEHASFVTLPVVRMSQLPRMRDIKYVFENAVSGLSADTVLKGMIKFI
jgi:predicted acyl esterase